MSKLFFILIPLTLLAAISLLIVAISFDPFKSEGAIKALFFASLSAFIWGCGAIVFFVLNFFSNDRPTDALRRGLFLAILVLILALLKKQGMLYWYTGFTAVIMTMLIEFWIYKKARLTVVNHNDYGN